MELAAQELLVHVGAQVIPTAVRLRFFASLRMTIVRRRTQSSPRCFAQPRTAVPHKSKKGTGDTPVPIPESLPYGSAEFLLEEITFVPGWTLWCIRHALPDQEIELGESHV